MPARSNRTLARSLIWPIRRLLDPRFDDVRRRLDDTRRAVHDEGTATRVAVGSLTDNFSHVVGGYAETNVESLTHLGVELRQLQEEVRNLGDDQRRLHEGQGQLAGALGDQAYASRLDAVVAKGVDGLDGAAANLVNHALGHTGFAAERELWLNPPIVLAHGERSVTWSATNERIVEVPFAFGAVADLEAPARILDVGGAESTISLSLAALGHHVTVLEPRGYPFAHPNLTVAAATIETFAPTAGEAFDAILLVSTIEHVGLGFYGEQSGAEGADRRALERLGTFLRPGGRVVITTPYGTAAVDEKERTYDAATLDALLEGWTVVRRQIAERRDDRTWTATDESTGPAVAMVVAEKA